MAAGLVASAPRWRLPCAAVASFILLDLIVVTSLQTAYWRDSKTLWTHALERTTENWAAHHGLGLAFSELNQKDDALAEFEETLRIRPGYAQGRLSLGLALEHRGEIDAAIEQYRQAIHYDPTLAEAHYNLGALLANHGSADEAIAEFRSASKCKPDYANAHYNLAVCLENQGKFAEAMQHWTAVAQLQPNNVNAIDDLAWRLATYPNASLRDGRKAIGLAERAIELL